MGARATLKIFSDDHDGAFHAQWASPQFKIPALARWIEDCKTNGEMPTASTYELFASADTADHFQEGFPIEDDDAGDLDYRYEVRTTATETGWAGDLTVWKRSRYAHQPEFSVWHQVSFSARDTAPIHHLASAALAELIRTAEGLNQPDCTPEAVQEWQRLAEAHRALTKTPRELVTVGGPQR